MAVKVSDFSGNRNETIESAASAIGRSKARQDVFTYIYKSKARFKPVSEISDATGLTKVRVLQEGERLVANHVVEKGKVHGETAYKKDATLTHFQQRILKIAHNPNVAKKYPTKQRPHVTGTTTIIRVRSAGPAPREITVDDVESFKLVRNVAFDPKLKLNGVLEKKIKGGLKKIIGETGEFTDWGGERNDLFTNKFRRAANRTTAAFALKGRATQGTLTPKKMGANGDQIGRLFGSAADVCFVVYHGKVDEAVHEQMRVHALGKSMTGRRVFYGVIDGNDLNRLYQAYRKHFK